MKLTCPICDSTNITNKGNGQEYAPRNEDDELYVGLDNDWYDGSVDHLECDNQHSFYLNNDDYDLPECKYKYTDDE